MVCTAYSERETDQRSNSPKLDTPLTLMQTSIVIPVHGECPFLLFALLSIENQDQLNQISACIVVLDREINSTITTLEEFVTKSKLLFRVLDSNEPGIVSSLNIGVYAAQC